MGVLEEEVGKTLEFFFKIIIIFSFFSSHTCAVESNCVIFFFCLKIPLDLTPNDKKNCSDSVA